MYYDILVKRGKHWQYHDKKPTQDMFAALKTRRLLRAYGGQVAMVTSSVNTRFKDSALRLVVSLTKRDAGKVEQTNKRPVA